MSDTKFLVTWDDTGDVGVVNLTKAELKEITTGTGSEKGEHHSVLIKHRFHWYRMYCQESDEKY
jgi:hypothetical protein